MPHRAGFWIRTFAAAIDLLAMVPIYLGAYLVMVAVWKRTGDTAAAEAVFHLLFGSIWLLYTMFEFFAAGTPGKMLLRLRIARMDSSDADFWRKFLRWSTKQLPVISGWLFDVTSFMPFYVLGAYSMVFVTIGCLYALDDDKLTWHDQWAGTAVWWKAKSQSSVIAPARTPTA